MSGAVARARALLQRLGPNATVEEVAAAQPEVGALATALAVDAVRKYGRGAAGALVRAEDFGAADSADLEPTVPELAEEKASWNYGTQRVA